MYNKWMGKSSAGFTLIELVVSITLLSMVIVILLPMFPQIFSWTKKAEVELVSSNLLDQYIYEIKNDETINNYILSQPNVNDCSIGATAYALEGYTAEMDGQSYTPKLTICQSAEEKELALYRMQIEIISDGKAVGNIYFYMTGEAESDE